MELILKIVIQSVINNVKNDELLTGVANFVIIPKSYVEGPKIIQKTLCHWELYIPNELEQKREKAKASLRRTIASTALELAQKINPSIVFVKNVDLCGLAGVLVSRTLNCPLILGLSDEDVKVSLFDERKVSILDSVLTTAHGVIVNDQETASIIKGYYPFLFEKIVISVDSDLDNPKIKNLFHKILNQRQKIPWERQHLSKSLLVSCPKLFGNELTYINEVLQSGWWGYGTVAKYLEQLFRLWLGENFHTLAVSSCTAALHLSLLASGIGPGDEVIVPSLTFVSTAASVAYTGATIRFADIDISTLSITSDTIAPALNEKTRAIIPVHFAGVPCDIQSIKELIEGKSIFIIEDAAHAIGAKYNGHLVGSQSPFTCFSFAPTKQLPSCGGGMLVFQNSKLESMLQQTSFMGLKLDTYQRNGKPGAGPKNEIGSLGYHYRMNDITAAIIISQLEKLEEIISHRTAIVAQYYKNLSSVQACNLLNIPTLSEPSWYIMPIRVSTAVRDPLREYLATKGIDTSVHYPILNKQVVFKDMPGDTPIAAQETQKLISLPLHSGMTTDDADKVCEIIVNYLSGVM